VIAMTGTAPRAPMPSPQAWRAQLDRSRGLFLFSDEAWNEVRRQFREVTADTRLLLKRPLEFPVLRQLADRALQLSQITFDELNAVTQRGRATSPAAVLEMLDDNRQLLDAIAAQQQLIAETHAAAEPLHSWAAAIVHGDLTSAEPWLGWTQELGDSIPRASHAALLPLAGVQLEESLSQAGWKRAGWFARALSSARLSAALGERLLEGDPRGTRWLTAAALMQDIGLWDIDGEPQRALRSRSVRLQQHPAIGAAMLGALPGCPAEIVTLVGTHEERIDGSGTPQRIAGRRLSRRSQLLGLIARVCDLANSTQCHADAQTHGETLEFAIALQLWREVRRGALREDLVRLMLDALEPGLSDDIVEAFTTRAHRFVDREHSTPQPHRGFLAPSPPDAMVPPPMYLRRRRNGVARWAYSSVAQASLTGADR